MKRVLFCAALAGGAAIAQSINCDMRQYKPAEGLTAENREGALQLSWQGERGDQLRASFGIRGGQPMVAELAARAAGGAWKTLGRNLTPEYEVTSGVRRMSEQQLAPLRELKTPLTPELIEREKWFAFWDAPLMVPGRQGTNMDLPRKPEEIRKTWANYHATGCQVTTEGSRIEVLFPGLDAGIFSGSLQYTVYRGS